MAAKPVKKQVTSIFSHISKRITSEKAIEHLYQKALVTREISWTLQDLTKEAIVQFESGKGFISSIFQLRFKNKLTKWCLCFYPNGSSNVQGCITVGLNALDLTDEPFDVEYKFEISGLSWSHSSPQLYNPSRDFLAELSRLNAWNLSPHLYYRNRDYIVERSSFNFDHIHIFNPKKNVLIFDSITIMCKISLFASTYSNIKQTEALFAVPFRDHDMFGNDFLTDFELKANDGETLRTHKFILAASSPVFYAMLSGDSKETQEGSMYIPDFDSKTLKEVLRFMYCNKVEDLYEIVCDLIFAAEKYQLDELKEICINHIIASLSAENVVNILVMADQLSDSSRLYEKCLEIVDNEESVRATREWEDLPGHIGSKIICDLLSRNSSVCVSTYQEI